MSKKTEGGICPHCFSTNVISEMEDFTTLVTDNSFAKPEISFSCACKNCGHDWMEYFDLTYNGYSEVVHYRADGEPYNNE